MRAEWLRLALRSAATKADFYSGARKILRNQHVTFRNIKPDLLIGDCGFGKAKLTMLRKSYIHSESRTAAVALWDGRLKREKYGSVGFHCFNHYVKGVANEHANERISGERPGSKRASVMGPCIQSVSITLLKKGSSSIDFFYRTTELFKKFPADLVFIRDELLAPFDFSRAPIDHVNFHFANVTCHPMYFVTMLPLFDDPVEELMKLRRADRYFHDWVVKWSARYVCDEYSRGIQKFAQALRVRKDALERFDRQALKDVQKYFRGNHPGHRNDYVDPDGEDE